MNIVLLVSDVDVENNKSSIFLVHQNLDFCWETHTNWKRREGIAGYVINGKIVTFLHDYRKWYIYPKLSEDPLED